MLKILLVGHSGYMYSGNAEVLRNIFIPLLTRYSDQYSVRQLGLVNVSAVTDVPWEVISTLDLLPDSDLYGEVTLPNLLSQWNPDIVFIFNDPWPALRQIRLIPASVQVVAYLSVDGFPLPPELGELCRARLIATMSEFSKGVLLQVPGLRGLEIRVVSAPVDIARFSPIGREEKFELRNRLYPNEVPVDKFVLGWVGRNQWRKQLWVNFHAMSLIKTGNYKICSNCHCVTADLTEIKFCQRCGCGNLESASPIKDIVLWIHTPTGPGSGDWNCIELEKIYNLTKSDIYYTDGCDDRHHLSRDDISALYKSWDALLCCSGGEGFGLPVIEAMACGIPVIYSMYSSHAEVATIANAGIGVTGVLQPERTSHIMRFISDPYAIVQSVLRLKDSPDASDELGKNGVRYARGVSMDVIAEVWHNIFEGLRG